MENLEFPDCLWLFLTFLLYNFRVKKLLNFNF